MIRSSVFRWHERVSPDTHVVVWLAADPQRIAAGEMMHAGGMGWAHRDPFDRMLVAQSRLNGLRLVTKDAAILGFAEADCLSWD